MQNEEQGVDLEEMLFKVGLDGKVERYVGPYADSQQNDLEE